MSGSAIAHRIDHVDALARTLYQRTKQIPPPAFEDAAVAVRRMYMTLRGLRTEATDPKSVLSQPESSATSLATLASMIDHSEAALRQLETVLDRFDVAGKKDHLAGRVASVELAKKELDLAIFLDSVQTRAKTTSATPARQTTPDQKKHHVGAVTSNAFGRHPDVRAADAEAALPQYKRTLERLGLTHDEIEAEAAIVEAERRRQSSELKDICDATNIPTYQSVAEFEVNTAPQVRHPVQLPVVPPKVPIPPPKEKSSPPRNEKSGFSRNSNASPEGDHSPKVLPTQYSFNVPHASMEDDKNQDLSTALISTKELVSMDSLSQNINGMHIHTDLTAAHSSRLGDNLSPTSPTVVGGSPQQHYSSVAADARTQAFPGTSPGRSSWLGPDRYGREIPPDAQWTKIRRTLVSPEVLHHAGVRYEARPDYVAILGRLSRQQIDEFARQSAECRAARSSRPPLPPRRSDDDARPTYIKADTTTHGDGARPTNLDTKSNADGARPINADAQSHGDGARSGKNLDGKSHHSDDDILCDSDDSSDYSGYHRTHAKGTRTYPYIVSPPSKNSKTSPSTTVKPKPILKNKHENHVRFDSEAHDLEHSSSAPSSYNHDRRRDYYYEQGSPSSSRRHREHHERDYDDRDERSHRSHRDRRERKKKSWGETLGAVGIGSAALLLGGVGF